MSPFGPGSKAPYLSQTLTGQGVLLTQYFGIGHASLDNYIAMISGQTATNETRNDCFVYAEFKLAGMTPDGQAIGTGCVYPATISTLADQLKAAGFRLAGSILCYEHGDLNQVAVKAPVECDDVSPVGVLEFLYATE
jgi:hypothetical protein